MTRKNEIIQMERAKFWVDNGILFCEIFNLDPTPNLKEDRVKHYLGAISKLCNGKKMPFLIDLRNTQGAVLSSATKKLGNSSELSLLSLTEAFVADSLKVKLLISSYKRIYEPNTPFAIFNNYNEALNYSINAKNS